MIRTILRTNNIDGTSIVEGFCLHDDTKPTAGLATGSSMTEVDTGDVYLYDEESQTWNKVGASGGSDEHIVY